MHVYHRTWVHLNSATDKSITHLGSRTVNMMDVRHAIDLHNFWRGTRDIFEIKY